MKDNHHIRTRNRNVKYSLRHRCKTPIPTTGYVPDNSLNVGNIVVGYVDNVLFIGEVVELHRYVGKVKTRGGVVIKIGKESKTRDIIKHESFESVDSIIKAAGITDVIS